MSAARPELLHLPCTEPLNSYAEVMPAATIVDLSQNPQSGRGRSELCDGSLMTLKTNSSRLYSKKHGRCLAGSELMTAMAVPTNPEFAALAGSPVLNIANVGQCTAAKLAGNGMNVAQAGAVLLIVAAFVRIK